MNVRDVRNGCERLVYVCANINDHDKVLIVSDTNTRKLGELIMKVAFEATPAVKHITIQPLAFHGQEPPKYVAQEMLRHTVTLGVTEMSMAHTQARRKASLLNGMRYLSLPDYSFEVLCSKALRADFKRITPLVNTITKILSDARYGKVEKDNGTQLQVTLKGRMGYAAAGWCSDPGTLASPPDIESSIAPIEDESNGNIVIDGSIPCRQIGLLGSPVRLKIKNGRVREIEGRWAGALGKIFDSKGNSKTRILGELGIGLNPHAKLSGIMLEDEGCKGTVHLGFGSNVSMGGVNAVSFHLDVVLRSPNLIVDGRPVIKKGKLLV